MKYPTTEQVMKADKLQLGTWIRFLPSPGSIAIDRPDFRKILDLESGTMRLIMKRFNELGGWTPELSKQIGWKCALKT